MGSPMDGTPHHLKTDGDRLIKGNLPMIIFIVEDGSYA